MPVVVAVSIAVSCSVSSQSQPSGRSLVSGKLCSSVEVNLVEISNVPRIRSQPGVYTDPSGDVASPARTGLRST